jgi:hypothetical protein
MADQKNNQPTRETIWVPQLLKYVAWLAGGAAFALGALATIGRLVGITSRLTYLGTGAFVFIWLVIELVIRSRKPKIADWVRLSQLGRHGRFFFIGAIAILWAPMVLAPLYTQKVEIILDASQRMRTELGSSGVTKFEAARNGALQLLDSFESTNTDVALRVLYGDSSGQCKLVMNQVAWSGFTQDYDELRNRLRGLRPESSHEAPLVDAMDQAVHDYKDVKSFDQKFHIFTFVGGDDTCGKSVELFLRSVMDESVVTDLFLVLLLGKEEPPAWSTLPNASLALARNVDDVQNIVHTYSQVIVPPTPVRSPAGLGIDATLDSNTQIPTVATLFEADQAVTPASEAEFETAIPDTTEPPNTPRPTTIPSSTKTLTPVPTATWTLSPVPTSTWSPTPFILPTDTETLIPTPTLTLSPCPSPRSRLVGAATYPGDITLDTLSNCTSGLQAEAAVNAAGHYSNTPPGTTIWVLVYPWTQGSYYPQTPFACNSPAPPPVQGNGDWNVNVYLGQKEKPPEWFDIVVLVTDQAASDFIGNWVHSGCPNNYSGIPPWQLEQLNITEKFSISVETRFTQ